MRKLLVGVALLAAVAAACGEDSDTASPADTGTETTSTSTSAAPATAADCAAGATFVKDGALTVGTDSPAYPPYFQGGAEKGSDWELNDPNTGEGFEAAVAYEIATRLGFSADQVEWIVVPWTQSFAPGPKAFDFDINQTEFSEKRAQQVDFSESYYDANQAIVVVKGTPIASATSVADLADYKLATQIGTTSAGLIEDYIGTTAGTYQTLRDAVAAINAGQADGLVVDYPTALYMADPFVQQVKDSIVLAQFPSDAVEGGAYFATVQAKDSPLTPCIDLALQEMKSDGMLEAITQEWLSEKTNVGEVPVWSE